MAPHVQPGHLRQSRGLGRLLLGLGRSVLQPPRLRSTAATVLGLLMQQTPADPRLAPPAAAVPTAAAVAVAAAATAAAVPAAAVPAAAVPAAAALAAAAAAAAPAKSAFKISKISRAPAAAVAVTAAASAPSIKLEPMPPPSLPARLAPSAPTSAAPPEPRVTQQPAAVPHPPDTAQRGSPTSQSDAQAPRSRGAKRETAGGEAGPEPHEGKRRRADVADTAQVAELLARLVKSLLKPAYQAKEISREGFKLVARAVTGRAREMAAAGQLPQSEEAITTVLASLVEDELARSPV